jgi:flavodoxin
MVNPIKYFSIRHHALQYSIRSSCPVIFPYQCIIIIAHSHIKLHFIRRLPRGGNAQDVFKNFFTKSFKALKHHAIMKILIAYYSETGNTKHVAEAIYEEASREHDVELVELQDGSIDALNNSQLVVLGAPCHGGDLAEPLKQFLATLPENPDFILAGFFTHAVFMPEGTTLRKELYEKWAGKCIPSFESVCQKKTIKFLGYFHCCGSPSPPVEAFIRQAIIPSDEEWKEYLSEIQNHPSAKDLENARDFAQTIIRNLPTEKTSI